MNHEHILLKCPICKRQVNAKRLDTDYPEAVRLEVTCPDCDVGDFAEPMYYDKNGKHINRDPTGEDDGTATED